MRSTDILSVCISLDRRPDRWDRFSAAAAVANIKVERLPAVDAAAFDQPAHQHPAVSVATAHHLLFGVRRSPYEIDRAGAVGASLSHIAAWKKLLASDAPALIVFEDDCPLPADFGTRLKFVVAAISSVGEDWDIIQFQRSTFGKDNQSDCKPVTTATEWHTCQSLTGAHAYMVSRRGAERLLARALPIELHVDAYMAFMSRLGLIRMLWHPMIDVPQPSVSDSDIGHGGGVIVGLPTHIDDAGLVVLSKESVIGLIIAAAVLGGLVVGGTMVAAAKQS